MKRVKFIPHFIFTLGLGLSGCVPRVQLDTPKEGITINMNVVVDHKINVEMDEKAKKVMEQNAE